jgi:hypothetical protein
MGMEAIKRISDLDPRDVPVVERLFGRRIESPAETELVLRVKPETTNQPPHGDGEDVPAWCNVLEGMSDADLADFDAILETPIRLAHPQA